ncbi:hypothetical protein YC2023_022066 [Brassica napus]
MIYIRKDRVATYQSNFWDYVTYNMVAQRKKGRIVNKSCGSFSLGRESPKLNQKLCKQEEEI